MRRHIYDNCIYNFLFCVSAFLFIFWQTIVYNAVDMDYWARLLQGFAFLDTGHILKTDIFSYTNTHLWLDHEWGASIIFAVVQKGGYTFILLFKSLLVFLTFFFMYKAVKIRNLKKESFRNTEKLKFFNLVYFILLVFAMPTITQSWLRCHFFTFLFFTFSLYILEKIRESSNYKFLIIFPFLMVFWANIHGGCVSLLGLLGIYTIGEFLNKNPFKYYLFALLCCIAVMFINPYGIEYVEFIFTAATMYRPNVTEWISPFMHSDLHFLFMFKLLYTANLILLIIDLKNLKKDYTKYLLLIICAYLSFRYIKNTPFFIITSAVFLYENLFVLFEKIKFKAKYLPGIFCVILIIFSLHNIRKNAFSLLFPDLSLQPVGVVKFIKNNNLKGNILAPFDMGSYIAYKLCPDNLIYMDGRYEEVYYNETKKLLDDFFIASGSWDKILSSDYRHDYLIIPNDAIVDDRLKKRNDYKKIYKDNNNSLYARTDILKTFYKTPARESQTETFSEAFSTSVKFK